MSFWIILKYLTKSYARSHTKRKKEKQKKEKKEMKQIPMQKLLNDIDDSQLLSALRKRALMSKNPSASNKAVEILFKMKGHLQGDVGVTNIIQDVYGKLTDNIEHGQRDNILPKSREDNRAFLDGKPEAHS